ncbi:hypothetical protein [Nitrososphaera sp. AFS]|uniref:hypothetical protein n=1 Tax=Nitrososphaera sp. AFS TaxID=2301191 RepID=UPI00139221B8|nr:hypothetical protein [Nitrososphaera sp. AFS]NAL77576.1 hypothetical protein [Nitrososphaera sp. AFS]
MIKLTKEDLIFKKAAEYPGPKLAAISWRRQMTPEQKKAKPYNQQSVTGLLKSVLGWNGAKQKENESWWADHRRNHYRSRSQSKCCRPMSSNVL